MTKQFSENSIDRAICRALDEGIKANRAVDRRHRFMVWTVGSSTIPGRLHIVSYDPMADLWACSCKAVKPCKHIGAAFVRMIDDQVTLQRMDAERDARRAAAMPAPSRNAGPRLWR